MKVAQLCAVKGTHSLGVILLKVQSAHFYRVGYIVVSSPFAVLYCILVYIYATCQKFEHALYKKCLFLNYHDYLDMAGPQ